MSHSFCIHVNFLVCTTLLWSLRDLSSWNSGLNPRLQNSHEIGIEPASALTTNIGGLQKVPTLQSIYYIYCTRTSMTILWRLTRKIVDEPSKIGSLAVQKAPYSHTFQSLVQTHTPTGMHALDWTSWGFWPVHTADGHNPWAGFLLWQSSLHGSTQPGFEQRSKLRSWGGDAPEIGG